MLVAAPGVEPGGGALGAGENKTLVPTRGGLCWLCWGYADVHDDAVDETPAEAAARAASAAPAIGIGPNEPGGEDGTAKASAEGALGAKVAVGKVAVGLIGGEQGRVEALPKAAVAAALVAAPAAVELLVAP